MEKENSYIKYNGKIGETKEIYPKHGKIARKHIKTIYVHADQVHNKKVIENAYDLFIEECKSSIKDGKYVEGTDIKII